VVEESGLVKIDANQVTEVRLSADGARVMLVLLDDTGQKISLSPRANCLNAVLSVAPRMPNPAPFISWTLEHGSDGKRPGPGAHASYAGSLAISSRSSLAGRGMATIATYGGSIGHSRRACAESVRTCQAIRASCCVTSSHAERSACAKARAFSIGNA